MKDMLYRKKRKRIWLIPLMVVLAVILTAGTIFAALHERGGRGSGERGSAAPDTTKTLPLNFINRNTASPYIALGDVNAGTTLYSKNAQQKCYPAGLTGLMTALVALDYASADTVITAGDEVHMLTYDSGEIAPGAQLTMEQLLQALLLPSGSDAAHIIAVQVGRSIAGDETLSNTAALETFCGKMNEKAKALGCVNTHFANPVGIHEDDHYTTAADMLKIGTAALGQEVIARTVALPSVEASMASGQSVTWTNANRMLQEGDAHFYAGATGMKAGSTSQAGYCLIASATRDGETAIAVVMGATAEQDRWEDAAGLLDICFQ